MPKPQIDYLLSRYLVLLINQESQIEVIRQLLCHNSTFNPVGAFNMITSIGGSTGRYITSVQLHDFLREYRGKVPRESCNTFLATFAEQRINAIQFLHLVYPIDNIHNVSFTMTSGNEPDHYYLLARLLEQHISAVMEIKDETKALRQISSEIGREMFLLLDRKNRSSIELDDFIEFFKKMSISFSQEDISHLMNALKFNQRTRMNYDEWHDRFKVPLGQPVANVAKNGRKSSAVSIPKSSVGITRVKSTTRAPARAITPVRRTPSMVESPQKPVAKKKRNCNSVVLMPSEPVNEQPAAELALDVSGRTVTRSVTPKKDSTAPTTATPSKLSRRDDTEREFGAAAPTVAARAGEGTVKSLLEPLTKSMTRCTGIAKLKLSTRQDEDCNERYVIMSRLMDMMTEVANLETSVEDMKKDVTSCDDFSLTHAFHIFDDRRRMAITPASVLSNVLQRGHQVTMATVRQFIARYDTNRKGILGLNEFSHAILPKLYCPILDIKTSSTHVISDRTTKKVVELIYCLCMIEDAYERIKKSLLEADFVATFYEMTCQRANTPISYHDLKQRFAVKLLSKNLEERGLKLLFRTLDQDRDGLITRVEFDKFVRSSLEFQ